MDFKDACSQARLFCEIADCSHILRVASSIASSSVGSSSKLPRLPLFQSPFVFDKQGPAEVKQPNPLFRPERENCEPLDCPLLIYCQATKRFSKTLQEYKVYRVIPSRAYETDLQ